MALVFGQQLDEEGQGELEDFADAGDAVLREGHAQVGLERRHKEVVVAKGLAAVLQDAQQ